MYINKKNVCEYFFYYTKEVTSLWRWKLLGNFGKLELSDYIWPEDSLAFQKRRGRQKNQLKVFPKETFLLCIFFSFLFVSLHFHESHKSKTNQKNVIKHNKAWPLLNTICSIVEIENIFNLYLFCFSFFK